MNAASAPSGYVSRLSQQIRDRVASMSRPVCDKAVCVTVDHYELFDGQSGQVMIHCSDSLFGETGSQVGVIVGLSVQEATVSSSFMVKTDVVPDSSGGFNVILTVEENCYAAC